MIEVAPDVEIPSVSGGGWSSAFASVVDVVLSSRSAAHAIVVTNTALANAGARRAASRCAPLGGSISLRTSVVATTPIDSSGTEIVVVDLSS
jgi:hypothetical protein